MKNPKQTSAIMRVDLIYKLDRYQPRHHQPVLSTPTWPSEITRRIHWASLKSRGDDTA